MYHYRAQVIAVYDADTIRADVDLGFGVILRNQSLRLAAVNAPEVSGAEREQGILARDALRGRLLREYVEILTIKDAKEKYGRYLAVVIHQGVTINDWLIQSGWAAVYQAHLPVVQAALKARRQ